MVVSALLRRSRSARRVKSEFCNSHQCLPRTNPANISVVAITDTSPEARAVQLKIQHGMSGQQRMLLAFEMSEFARELARAGIRKDHPEWSEWQVARELLRLAFLPEPLPTWVR